MTITVEVTGMTCGHCKMHVEEELGALAGVTGVDVALNTEGASIVTISGEATDEEIREAIDEAGGYTVVSITR